MKKNIITLTAIILALILVLSFVLVIVTKSNQSDIEKLNAKIDTLNTKILDLKAHNNYLHDQIISEFDKKTDAILFSTIKLLAAESTIFKSTEIDSLGWLTDFYKVESVNSLKSKNFTSTYDNAKDYIIYSKDNLSLGYSAASEYTQLKWVKITGQTNYDIPRDIKIGDSLEKVLTLFPINTNWEQSSLNVVYNSNSESNTLTSEYGVFNNQTLRLVDQPDTAYMEVDFSKDIVTEIRLIMN